MIDFRYHVVSIIAVFLALALGLFLGSTTLQDAVVHSLKSNTDRVARENRSLDTRLRAAQAQVNADQTFDRALLPFAVSGRLSGQLVSVISAPGASDSLRKQVVAAIEAAGGTPSADVRLQDTIVDPQQETFLTALTDRVTIPGHPATGSSGAARAAAQLAAVLGVRPSSHAVGAGTVETVLSAYSTGKLISFDATPPPRPGTLAVVLSGPPPSAGADPAAVKAQQTFVLQLLRDLDASSLGAVLAAPAPPPGTADLVAAAASDGVTDEASTVTGVDTPAGLIAAVFALAAQADGTSGRFGPAGAATPLPTASSGS